MCGQCCYWLDQTKSSINQSMLTVARFLWERHWRTRSMLSLSEAFQLANGSFRRSTKLWNLMDSGLSVQTAVRCMSFSRLHSFLKWISFDVQKQSCLGWCCLLLLEPFRKGPCHKNGLWHSVQRSLQSQWRRALKTTIYGVYGCVGSRGASWVLCSSNT